MSKLLNLKDDYNWDLEGIEFAIEERIGNPEDFTGRVREMKYLYNWAQGIKDKRSRTLAFLGRRKIGKSLMLERLYNLIYSENQGLIPFYYEFKEGEITAKEFAEDFITKFYMQVVGYYTRDINWIRRANKKKENIGIDELVEKISDLDFRNKNIIIEELGNYS